MSVERFMGSATSLGEREIGVIASTDELARDGDIVIPAGIDLTAYKRNPVVLFNHEYSRIVGIATAVGVDDGKLAARIQFVPEGVSPDADLVCNLTKGGTLRGISIGFMPKEQEPIDPARPFAGQRITSSELLEISVVAVPADTGALVVARSFAAQPGALRLLRSLPSTTASARERVLTRLSETRPKPVGLMNEFERAAFCRDHQVKRTMTVWAAGQASEAEDQARRRARVAELKKDAR